MRYKKTQLKNGSSLVILQIPSSSSVTISAYIKAGYRYDPLNKPGLAHFTEHMLFTGTRKYPTHRDLARVIEKYGGFHMAFTWIDYQNHYIRFPRQQFKLGAEILLDTLFQSTILVEELEKEKGVVEEEIRRNLSDPAKAIWSYVWLPHFFQGTALSKPYTGTSKDVDSFTRNDVTQFINSHFQPDEIVYLLAGDVEEKEAKDVFENILIKGLYRQNKKIIPSIEPKVDERVVVRTQESDYISLIFAIPTVSIYSKERHPLEILKNILARGFSGSLPDKLRNHGGLIYTWYSTQDNHYDTGYLLFQTATSKKNMPDVIKIILDEFRRIGQGKIKDEEIEISKSNLTGNLLTNMETGTDYIHWYALQELYALTPVLHIQDQIKIYKNISKKEILDVAKRYFSPDRIYIAGCGNIYQSEIEKIRTHYV